MLNDLFWHLVVFAIGVFFIFTAVTQLPEWQSGASAYSAPPPAYTQAGQQTLTAETARHQTTPTSDIQLASAR